MSYCAAQCQHTANSLLLLTEASVTFSLTLFMILTYQKAYFDMFLTHGRQIGHSIENRFSKKYKSQFVSVTSALTGKAFDGITQKQLGYELLAWGIQVHVCETINALPSDLKTLQGVDGSYSHCDTKTILRMWNSAHLQA